MTWPKSQNQFPPTHQPNKEDPLQQNFDLSELMRQGTIPFGGYPNVGQISQVVAPSIYNTATVTSVTDAHVNYPMNNVHPFLWVPSQPTVHPYLNRPVYDIPPISLERIHQNITPCVDVDGHLVFNNQSCYFPPQASQRPYGFLQGENLYQPYPKRLSQGFLAPPNTPRQPQPRLCFERVEGPSLFSPILEIPQIRFSGDEDSDPVDFKESFREYQNAVQMTQDEMVRLLPLLLIGQAKAWFRQKFALIQSWEDFEYLFDQQFLDRLYYEELWRKIYEERQGESETAKDYVNRMINLYNRLSIANRPPERLILRQIKSGLLAQYQALLCFREIKTIRELQVAVVEMVPAFFFLKNALQSRKKN